MILWQTFSLIPFSNESPAIIIFIFLNCSFVPLHEFLIILQSSLLSSESLDWTKETLPLIPLLTNWQLSYTNFFVRNFILVCFCFSSFSKNTILSFKRSTTKPDEASTPLADSWRLLYVAVCNYCFLHTMQSTLHRISEFFKTFRILQQFIQVFIFLCVVNCGICLIHAWIFHFWEVWFILSIICVCGAKILSGREE